MKAVQVNNSIPQLVDIPAPEGEGVRVQVRAASICGSDIHLLNTDFVEGAVLGHEFAGLTPDGTAVAVEPVQGCGECLSCTDGFTAHCDKQASHVGVMLQGGMAEYVVVPEHTLVPLPSGLDVRNASLVEPLAVGVHGVHRAGLQKNARTLVVGAGAIGLAAVAALHNAGFQPDVIARHEHQKAAAEGLGGVNRSGEGYDAVFDCAGSADSLRISQERVRPLGAVILLGTLWAPASIDMMLCQKEISLIPSMGYKMGAHPDRSFDAAARMLLEHPGIAETLITHRFPLDGVDEAFAAASNRAAGAIKVAFEI